MGHVEWQKSLGVLMAEEVGNKMLDGKNASLQTNAVHALADFHHDMVVVD
jgi:hypothetical protein